MARATNDASNEKERKLQNSEVLNLFVTERNLISAYLYLPYFVNISLSGGNAVNTVRSCEDSTRLWNA